MVALCPLGTLCRYAGCRLHCLEHSSLVSPTDCAIGRQVAFGLALWQAVPLMQCLNRQFWVRKPANEVNTTIFHL